MREIGAAHRHFCRERLGAFAVQHPFQYNHCRGHPHHAIKSAT